ncbi:MAG: hypothetical protein AB1405_10295 [Bdellovibrionota bacterium]
MNESAKNPSSPAKRPYEAPRISHEEQIESVAVACDPALNPGQPVKEVPGPRPGGFCAEGFLNS